MRLEMEGKMLFKILEKEEFFQFCRVVPVFKGKQVLAVESEKNPVLKLKSFSLAFGTQVFKALGDDSRLRILHLLLERSELSVTDLEMILEFTQTKTARLLGILKNAGLVQSRRENYYVFYRITEESSEILADLLLFMEKDPVFQHDVQMARVLELNRELTRQKIDDKQYKPNPFRHD
jgi:ArsR family transcriptional regulator